MHSFLVPEETGCLYTSVEAAPLHCNYSVSKQSPLNQVGWNMVITVLQKLLVSLVSVAHASK